MWPHHRTITASQLKAPWKTAVSNRARISTVARLSDAARVSGSATEVTLGAAVGMGSLNQRSTNRPPSWVRPHTGHVADEKAFSLQAIRRTRSRETVLSTDPGTGCPDRSTTPDHRPPSRGPRPVQHSAIGLLCHLGRGPPSPGRKMRSCDTRHVPTQSGAAAAVARTWTARHTRNIPCRIGSRC